MITAGVLEGKGVLLRRGIAGNVELIMEVVGEEERHAATIGIMLVGKNSEESLDDLSFVLCTTVPLS